MRGLLRPGVSVGIPIELGGIAPALNPPGAAGGDTLGIPGLSEVEPPSCACAPADARTTTAAASGASFLSIRSITVFLLISFCALADRCPHSRIDVRARGHGHDRPISKCILFTHGCLCCIGPARSRVPIKFLCAWRRSRLRDADDCDVKIRADRSRVSPQNVPRLTAV